MAQNDFWVRGHSAFEVSCGKNAKTRVLFALIEQDQASPDMAWYLFSSNIGAAQKQCDPDTSVMVWDDPFADDTLSGIANHVHLRKAIDVDKLADGLLDPPTMKIERGVECRLFLHTTPNKRFDFAFHMHENFKPPAPRDPKHPDKPIAGTLYFLERVSFDQKTFTAGPQKPASNVKMHGQVS